MGGKETMWAWHLNMMISLWYELRSLGPMDKCSFTANIIICEGRSLFNTHVANNQNDTSDSCYNQQHSYSTGSHYNAS